MWLKYDMEEKWLWSCVKIFVEQEELWWAFGHFSGSGREGAHFLSLCGLMSYQDQVCSALRRQGSQEPFSDECCQRGSFCEVGTA